MNLQQHEDEQWSQCPEGQFSKLATALRKRSQRRRFLVVSATAATGSLVGIGLLILAKTDDSPSVQATVPLPSYEYGGISCVEVKQNIEQYVSLQCAPEIVAKIDSHLQQCTSCKQLIDLARASQEIGA